MTKKDARGAAVAVFPREKVAAVSKALGESGSALSWEELFKSAEDLSSFSKRFEKAKLFVFGPFYLGRSCAGWSPSEGNLIRRVCQCLTEYTCAEGVLSILLISGSGYPFSDWREGDDCGARDRLFLTACAVKRIDWMLSIPVKKPGTFEKLLRFEENATPQVPEFSRVVPEQLRRFIKRHNNNLRLRWDTACDERFHQAIAWYSRMKEPAAFYLLNGRGRGLVLPLMKDLTRADINALTAAFDSTAKMDGALPGPPWPPTPERGSIQVLGKLSGHVVIRAFGRECHLENDSGFFIIYLADCGAEGMTEDELGAKFFTTNLSTLDRKYSRLRADLDKEGFAPIEVRAIVQRAVGDKVVRYRLGDFLLR